MRKPAEQPMPAVIQDTREQLPFEFDWPTVVRGLATADYSIDGFEDYVAIERKSKSDLWGCVAGERARFERCLERLAAITCPVVIVECSLHDFSVQPPTIQRVRVSSAVGSCASWQAQYRIPFVWAGSRAYAQRMAWRHLSSFWKHRAAIMEGR